MGTQTGKILKTKKVRGEPELKINNKNNKEPVDRVRIHANAKVKFFGYQS